MPFESEAGYFEDSHASFAALVNPCRRIKGISKVLAVAVVAMLTGCSGRDPAKASDGKVAEAEREYAAAQAQLAALENSLPKPGQWVRAESTDKMDGSKTVQFKSFSENKVQLSEHEERLLLAIGCAKYVDMFIEPGSVSTSSIRYKFDNAVAQQDRWDASDNRYLVKVLVRRDFLKSMTGAKKMKIEFSPLGKEPQIATFDMGDFSELIQNEKGCNFMKKAWALNF